MRKPPKLEYPSHLLYTTHDNLLRLVPSSFSHEQVSVKELLDNSCDAAERNGGTVSISLAKSRFRISNVGVISKEEIAKIITFHTNITEKYMKRAYIRGQIGHGLKIALMLAISEDHDIYVTSGGHHHVIKLVNRYAPDAGGVLEVISQEIPFEGTTTFDIPILEGADEIEDYVLRYIALNPHIDFVFNSARYEPRSLPRKSDKADIFSYELEDFNGFAKSYLTQGFPPEDFISIFNVKKTKIKTVLESHEKGIESLYRSLRRNSMKIRTPLLGEEAVAARIKDVFSKRVLAYDKLIFKNKESLEIAFVEGDAPDLIAGVNGTCLDGFTFWIDKRNVSYPLVGVMEELKIRKPLFLSYHSTAPEYKDSNKQMVIISSSRAYNAIRRLYKTYFPDKLGSEEWLISKAVYRHRVHQEPEIRVEARKIGVHPITYCFLRESREIALSMFEKYGPITLRQLYYQLVSRAIIQNLASSYDNFINHLTTARQEGFIDYDIFEDRSRYTRFPSTVPLDTDPEVYIRNQIGNVLIKPEINLWDSQPHYVELWIEKDALVGLFDPIASEMQVPLFPARGYTSVTKIKEAEKRFKEKVRGNKKVVVLYAGDLDPSGLGIYKDICSKLKEVKDITIERHALNIAQAKDLVPMPIKKSDTRYEAFLKDHPGIKGAYELDAMDPEELRNLTRGAIEKYFDKGLVPREKIALWEEKFKTTKKSLFEKIGLA